MSKILDTALISLEGRKIISGTVSRAEAWVRPDIPWCSPEINTIKELHCRSIVEVYAGIPEGHSNDQYKEVCSRMLRELAEKMYGEFRKDLHVIRLALMDYRVDDAFQGVLELERKMFQPTKG